MSNWDTYYKIQAARKPREQTIRAASLCVEKEHALDLGAGTLTESVFLLENGFKKVTAIDSSQEVGVFAEGIDPKRLFLRITQYQDFDFPQNEFDLVNAQFSLPFYGPDNFENFIEKAKISLNAQGIFAGQFFGVNDSWNIEGGKLAFHTKIQALKLLSNLEIVEFTEVEKDGQTAAGEVKHWHVFHFIAKNHF